MAVGALLRFGLSRPHVFLAVLPGGARTRLAVERFARERGWPIAGSPADTDVLVVCGQPSGWLSESLDVVWAQVPAPRARVRLGPADDVPGPLLAARRVLRTSGDPEPERGKQVPVDELPMADRGPDRDGLDLDQLHVAFGPFLPAWPAGLRLRFLLRGDVATEVSVDHSPTDSGDADVFSASPRALAAGRLDALSALLEVAGAVGPAVRARALRDRLLGDDDAGEGVGRLARALRRSRLLRWSTDGMAPVGGLDATGRWQAWLDEACRAVEGTKIAPLAPAVSWEALPGVLDGLELMGLRIAVASLLPPVGASSVARSAHV